jgi:hypothetical protein
MIHYGTYRGAVVGLRGAVVGVRGAAVGVRGAAVGNIGIPTYVISRGAVVRIFTMLYTYYSVLYFNFPYSDARSRRRITVSDTPTSPCSDPGSSTTADRPETNLGK